MEFELIVKVIVLVLLIVFFILRSSFIKHYKTFTFRLSIKYIVTIILLILYFGGYFDFAMLGINSYVRMILGLLIIFIGMVLFFWTHAHLGKNWSPVIEKKFTKSRKLIKTGPYRHMRHPIYSASFVTLIGFGIFTANWLIFVVPLVILVVFYAIKIPKEEKELTRNFGKEYEKYMKDTPRFIPNF